MQLTTQTAVSWFNEQPKEVQHELTADFLRAFPNTQGHIFLFEFPDWLLLSNAPVIAGELEQDQTDLTQVKRFSLLTLLFIALLAGLFSSCNTSTTGKRSAAPKQLVVLDEAIYNEYLSEHGKEYHYARIVGDSTNCTHLVICNQAFGEGDTIQAHIIE